jgi:hypothetical protein
VASIYPCAQQQKLVKLVLPVENLMYSSVNLDGGYMKRSFVRSQWFLLSSETTASRVIIKPQALDKTSCYKCNGTKREAGLTAQGWGYFQVFKILKPLKGVSFKKVFKKF